MASGASSAGSSYSASSVGEGIAGPTNRIGKKKTEDSDAVDTFSSRRAFVISVFGVLFTLSKEKDDVVVYKWVILKAVLDFWQLFVTVVKPYMGWKINAGSRLWWWINLPNFEFLEDMNYNVFVMLLYFMVALLVLNVALCMYVAYGFHRHQFDHVWPIKVLRVFTSIFFQAFDVASINLLQIGFSCNYVGFPKAVTGKFAIHPEHSCVELPQLVHAIVSGVCLLGFILLGLILNMAEVEVNPYNKRFVALGHSGPEVLAFALKALLATIDVFFGFRKLLAVIYLIISGGLFYLYYRWSPHFTDWMNHVKTATMATITYISACLVMLTFGWSIGEDKLQGWRRGLTIAMLVGILPSGVFGYFLSMWRLNSFHKSVREALAKATSETKHKEIYKFETPQDVEIAARCSRVWGEDGLIDPTALSQASSIYKAGLAVFPFNAYITALYADFLMDGSGLFQAGRRQLQAASKQDPSLMVRFMLFVREQEATQRLAGGSSGAGVGNMDLVGYVDFQNKYRMVIRAHKEALLAMSQFWQILQSHHVSFKSLSRAISQIELNVRKADKAYGSVLEQYSNSTKLIRLYARFLETVKNDPQGSARFYAEATKLEELHGDGSADEGGILSLLGEGATGMAEGAAAIRAAMDEGSSLTIVANAAGIIQMVNKKVTGVLGYKKGELEGKNLNSLMPQPWSSKHTGYLKKYIKRGDDCIALGPSHVVAVHKEGYGIPVRLAIAKASGMGEDSIFIGILEAVKPRPNLSTMWVLPTSVIVSVDLGFSAMFGYQPHELINTRLVDILTDQEDIRNYDVAKNDETIEGMESIVSRILQAQPEMISNSLTNSSLTKTYIEQPSIGRHQLMLRHRYTSPLACNVTVREAGTLGAIAFQLEIEVVNSKDQFVMVFDCKGSLRYMSGDMANVLGTQALLPFIISQSYQRTLHLQRLGNVGNEPHPHQQQAALQDAANCDLKLWDFVPQPWSNLHTRWLKDALEPQSILHKPNKFGCRSNIEVKAASILQLCDMKGNPLTMRIAVNMQEDKGEMLHLVKAAKSDVEESLNSRRVLMELSNDGYVQSVEAGADADLLGFDPQEAIGKHLSSFVEIGDVLAADEEHKPSFEVFRSMLHRVLRSTTASWFVGVLPPDTRVKILSKNLDSTLQISLLNKKLKAAVLQIESVLSVESASLVSLTATLWPLNALSGVLELDNKRGKIIGVLEEDIRPVGLIFGVPNTKLVNMTLSSIFNTSSLSVVQTAQTAGKVLDSRAILNVLLEGSLTTKAKGALKGARNAVPFVGSVNKLSVLHVFGDVQAMRVSLQLSYKPGQSNMFAYIKPLENQPPTPEAFRRMILSRSISGILNPGLDTPFHGGGGEGGTIHHNRPVARSSFTNKNKPAFGVLKPQESTNQITRKSISYAALDLPQKPPNPPSAPVPFKDLAAPAPRPPTPTMGAEHTPPKESDSDNLRTPPAAAEECKGPAEAPPQPDAAPLKDEDDVKSLGALGLALDEIELHKKPGSAEKKEGIRTVTPPLRLPNGAPADDKANNFDQLVVGEDSTLLLRSLHDLHPLKSGLEHEKSDIRHLEDDTLEATTPGNTMSQMQVSIMSRSKVKMNANIDVEGTHEKEERDEEEEGDCLSESGDINAAGLQLQPGKASMINIWVQSEGAYYQSRPDLTLSQKAGHGVRPLSVRPTGHGGITAPSPHLSPRQRARALESTTSGTKFLHMNYSDSGTPVVRTGNFQDTDMALNAMMESDSSNMDKAGQGTPTNRGNTGQLNSNPGNEAFDGEEMLQSGQLLISSGASLGGSDLSGKSSVKSSASTASDYQSQKRLKKLLRHLFSPVAQRFIKRFRVHTTMIALLLVIGHVICFSFMVTALRKQDDLVVTLSQNMRASQNDAYILLAARVIDLMYKGRGTNLYTMVDLPEWLNVLDENSRDMREQLDTVFINSHSEKGVLYKVLNFDKYYAWDGWNVTTGLPIYRNMSLHELGVQIVISARQIFELHANYSADGNISSHYDFVFLLLNAPVFIPGFRHVLDHLFHGTVAATDNVNMLHLAFLALEGCGLACLAALYISYLIRQVGERRYRLYEVFMTIPTGLMKNLATHTLHLLDDDESSEEASENNNDDEEGDQDDNKKNLKRKSSVALMADVEVIKTEAAHKPKKFLGFHESTSKDEDAVPGGLSRRASVPQEMGLAQTRIYGSKKDLGGSSIRPRMARDYLNCCWNGQLKEILMSWIPARLRSNRVLPTSSMRLEHASRRLKRDSTATQRLMWPFLLWSACVIVVYSIGYYMLQASHQPLANQAVVNYCLNRIIHVSAHAQELCALESFEELPYKLDEFNQNLLKFKWVYYTMLLGEDARLITGPGTEIFPLVTGAIVGDSGEMANLMFTSTECMRTDKSTCQPPTWLYYQLSRSAVNSMMKVFLDKMTNLQEVATLTPQNLSLQRPEMDFIFQLAIRDMQNGVAVMSRVHEVSLEDPFKLVTKLHIAMLVIMAVGVTAFIFFLMKPLLKTIRKETYRIAELLSQLPRELDMTKAVLAAVTLDSAPLDGTKPQEKSLGMSKAMRGSSSLGGFVAGDMKDF